MSNSIAFFKSQGVSVYIYQHRRFLGRLNYLLKLAVLTARLLEPGGNVRHRFEKAQQETALHGVG